MKRLPFLLLLLAGNAFALEPIQLSPSAFYVRGEAGPPSLANRGFTSNAGFVITREGVVVFDALGTPALGAELLAAIRSLTRTPIRRVFVSHYHADHFYGLAAFEAEGARIYAHEAAEAYLASDAPLRRLEERSQTLAPWVAADMRLVAPDYWVTRESSFKLGGLTFRVVPVGPAHTPEDLALMVEEEGVLFAGDIISGGRVPFVGDADSKSWIEAIDRIVELSPRVLVGGHGEASYKAAADLRLTREYLVYLRKTMGDAASGLVDFDEAYAKTDWSRFSRLPAFEAENRRNAYSTYLRIQGGDK